ncbi:MAG: TRAP transporter substrate-binding protein DctP, partial [Clostridia bacterium]|nr:TRAP transporter substrate-binding protein DctP [Clostridia bacterium]
ILDKTGNNFRIMGYWTSSVRDYYGKKEVKTAADMKGMSIRTQTSGVVADFWTKLGATPSNVAWGELYQALQQGVVDSAENDYTTRLFLMNGNFYDSLSDEMKGWIDEAAKAATAEERQVTYNMMGQSKAAVIADGAEVVNFEDLDIESFKSVAIPIQDEFAKKNGMTELLEMVRNAK